ncbi:MAG: glycoside hydrolase family 73 protein [Acidobacteriota bacterium]
MTTPEEKDFLTRAYTAAIAANHIYPEMAVCEAALESGWGKSELAVKANNLFGRKVWKAGQDVLVLPTKEFLHGEWVTVSADWLKFATWADCFADRAHILMTDPRYQASMGAKTAEEYAVAVSKVWSTDPQRATKVLQTYRAHCSVFSQKA